MPISKYKTLEDAERDMINFNPDHEYFKQSRLLWKIAEKLNPIICQKGVFKFKSIEEANRHREEWELSNAIELQRKKQISKLTKESSDTQ